MQLTIDNFDGAGARDYTAAIDAEQAPQILRKLNQPAQLTLRLLAPSPDFVVPAQGARVVVVQNDGVVLFTGYLPAVPEYEYLGWGERGPAYRYTLAATSDEFLLNRKPYPKRAAFVVRTAGAALKQAADDLLPGVFVTDNVADLDTLPFYASSPEKNWSELASEIGLRTRALYRVHDGQVHFVPVGQVQHVLDETSPAFSPEGLRIASPARLVNDVTVIGNSEPRAHVKDYFLGDGLTLNFDLSHTPFTRRDYAFVEEEFKDPQLSALYWAVSDSGNAVTISGGKLQVAGGPATVSFVEQVELGGALVLQHGDIEFTAASSGLIGGLYSDGLDAAHCVAGFRATPSGQQSLLEAIVNGAASGTSITTQAGWRYLLSTRAYAREVYRRQQTFHSSLHPAGNGLGGASVASSIHLVLEVHQIDPNNPGTLAASSTVLYDGIVASAPDYCTYALINASAMYCSLAFTRLVRAVDVEVGSAPPSQSNRTRLVGSLSEGAECRITTAPQLQFYPQYVPVSNEAIRVSYRGAASAMARITDPASIAALARGNDDGVRRGVKRIAAPSVRSTADCENAALALLEDLTQPAWTGEYTAWSDALPSGDVFPGDAVNVNAPSRAAAFQATVREVQIELADLDGDRSRYQLRFANDAAEPWFAFDAAHLGSPLDLTATTDTTGTTFLADLSAAEVTAITSTTISIDAGNTPPSGGGIEVRRSDYGWGQENDRNLAGRFTTQSFTVPRLTRVQTYYLRQYDASTPPRYSRYSAVLHVNYPY